MDHSSLEHWANLDQESLIDKLKSEDVPINVLIEYGNSEDWEVRIAVALHHNTPKEVLEKLSNDEDTDVVDAVAFRDLPEEWKYLDSEEMREKLQEDKEVDLEVINIFANSQNFSLKAAIAIHPVTPPEVLEKLADDDEDSVKDAIAYRELPQEWKYLDDDEKIEKLKEESYVDHAVIKILANSSHYPLREAVALHSSTTTEILEELKNDEAEWVIDAITFRDLPEEWKYLDTDEKKEKLESEKKVDLKVLNLLSESKFDYLREAVAAHPATSKEILQKLIKDNDNDVKKIANKIMKKKFPHNPKQDESIALKLNHLEKTISLSKGTKRYLIIRNKDQLENILKDIDEIDYFLIKLPDENFYHNILDLFLIKNSEIDNKYGLEKNSWIEIDSSDKEEIMENSSVKILWDDFYPVLIEDIDSVEENQLFLIFIEVSENNSISIRWIDDFTNIEQSTKNTLILEDYPTKEDEQLILSLETESLTLGNVEIDCVDNKFEPKKVKLERFNKISDKLVNDKELLGIDSLIGISYCDNKINLDQVSGLGSYHYLYKSKNC